MIHPIWKYHGDIEEALVSVKHIMISEMSSLPPDIKTTILDYINASGKYLRAGLCLYLEKEIQGNLSRKTVSRSSYRNLSFSYPYPR